MAKHGKGRNMKGYMRGNVDETLALGTLATKTLVAQVFDESPDEEAFATSLVATHSLDNSTVVIGDGPILVGVAHSDYTAAEIEQFIENTGSWSRGDLISQEIAKRRIRIIGKFSFNDASEVLNNGKPIKTKLGWTLVTGASIDQWAYNLGLSALATTDPQYQISGHVNLFAR